MKLELWLKNRGLSQDTIADLIPYIPVVMNDMPIDDFCDAESIMNPDRWFFWPDQTRFVLVGLCPNGDGVAIDTTVNSGCIYYISHDLLDDKSVDEVSIKVADSPSDYVNKRSHDDFPWDFWEALKNRSPNKPVH